MEMPSEIRCRNGLTIHPSIFLPFIANFERLFDSLVVPPELRVSLITPYLSDRCRNLINRLQGEDATSYEFVKQYLMDQLRLVPSYFVDQFNHITKYQSETYKSFASRLTTLLKYYIDSRKVTDIDSLLQLLVCDRIKSVLPEGALSHLLRTEVNLEHQWARRDNLCDVLDTYYSLYDRFDKPKASALGANAAPQVNRFQSGRGYGDRPGEKPSVVINTPKPPEPKPVFQTLSSVAAPAQQFNRRPQNLASVICFHYGGRAIFVIIAQVLHSNLHLVGLM